MRATSRLADQLLNPVLQHSNSQRPSGSKGQRQRQRKFVERVVEEVYQNRFFNDGLSVSQSRSNQGLDTVDGSGMNRISESHSEDIVDTMISASSSNSQELHSPIYKDLSREIKGCSEGGEIVPLPGNQHIGNCIHFKAITLQDVNENESRRRAFYRKQDAITLTQSSVSVSSNNKSSRKKGRVRQGNDNNKQSALTYRMNSNSKIIKDILEYHHFRRVGSKNNDKIEKIEYSKEENRELLPWLLFWSSKHLPTNFYKSIRSSYQRVNQFPGSNEITRKDTLTRNILRMSFLHGHKHFDFMPMSYIFPIEREAIITAISSDPSVKWIIKPAGSSQGKGISIVDPRSIYQSQSHGSVPLPDYNKLLPSTNSASNTKSNNEHSKDNYIIEKYIDNPLLIHSRKFDLRLYVVVTSFNPVVIYIHEQGLIRLASKEYKHDRYDDVYMHLTNYSINKKNTGNGLNGTSKSHKGDRYGKSGDDGDNDDNGKDIHDTTCLPISAQKEEQDVSDDELTSIKLPLSDLQSYCNLSFEEHHMLMNNIHDVIIKTLLSAESKINVACKMHTASPESSFQLFGFDILIDEEMKPWLIEVNFAPSLATDSTLDFEVKSHVIADLFTLIGVKGDGSTCTGSSAESAYLSTNGSNNNCGIESNDPYRRREVIVPPNLPISSPLRSKSAQSVNHHPDGNNGDNGTISKEERRLVSHYIKEWRRAQYTGYTMICPQAGDASTAYLSFLDESLDNTLMLCHYLFTCDYNPSQRKEAIELAKMAEKRTTQTSQEIDKAHINPDVCNKDGTGTGTTTSTSTPSSPSRYKHKSKLNESQQEALRIEQRWNKRIAGFKNR